MKSILIIVPFDNIYPPMNGGMQRCFHIMHQLARHFELTAIIHQDKKSFLKCAEEFPSMTKARIYSTNDVVTKDIFNLFPSKLKKAFRSRWYQREWNRPADGSLIKYYPVLTQLLKQQQFDAIILENIATLNAVKIIRRFNKKVKIIYNAHNVDSNLAKAAYNRNEISLSRLQSLQKTEDNLHKTVNAIFTCSDKDKQDFQKMNDGKLLAQVIPNGVSILPFTNNSNAVQEEPKYILFCGSLWSVPNAEGLQWFCKKIWPLVSKDHPRLKLLIVGVGELPAKYADIKGTENTEFIGAVDNVAPWYQKSAVAVVPLLTGSGTRLKVLEAMGMGVPVVSTSIGAEGIDYTPDENILIADDEINFASKITTLLQSKNLRLQIAASARELVEKKYDWNVIGETMNRFLKGITVK